MARLPTRDDLGGLPSVKTGRATPDIRIATPDISAASRAKVRAAEEIGRANVSSADQIGRSQMRAAEELGRGAMQLAEAKGAGGVAINRGLQALAVGVNSIAEAADRRQEEENALSLMRADADLKLSSAQKTRALIDGDPNYQGWGDSYREQIEPDIEAVAATIKDPASREKFLIAAKLDAGLQHDKILGEATKRDRIAKVADLTETLEKLDERYSVATTDAEREQVEAEYKRNIDGAIQLGLIDDLDGLRLLNGAKKMIAVAAKAHLAEDPEGFLREIEKRGGRTKAIVRRVEGTSDRDAWRHGFTSGYDIPLGYGAWGRPPKPLTEMTLKEVFAFGRSMMVAQKDAGWAERDLSSAVGAYQIVGNTMKQFMEEAGLTGKDKFNEENQDKLFDVIMKRQGLKASTWQGFAKHPEALEEAKASVDLPSGRYASLDPEDRVNLTITAKNALEDRLKVGHPYEAALQLADPLKMWDPTDPDDKKRLDALIQGDKGANLLMQMDDEYLDGSVISLLERVGMVPRDVKGAFQAMIRTKDVKVVTWALSSMDRLEAINPEAFRRDMGEDAVRKVIRYREQLPYRKPEEIVEEMRRSEDPSRAEARKSALAEGLKLAQDVSDGTITDHFDLGIFYAEPNMPSGVLTGGELRRDFERLVAEEYVATGDFGAAQANALKLLEGVWGTTDITGTRQLMRRPPEQYYNVPGLEPTWMGEQAADDLKPYVGEDDDFVIRADATTEEEIAKGQAPSYLVIVRRDTGTFETLVNPDNGETIRIHFDSKPYVEKHRKEQEKKREDFSVKQKEAVKVKGVSDMTTPQDAVSAINPMIPGP